jgi:transposase
MIKAGAASLRESARLTGQSEQHLRRYIKENVGAVRVGKRWIINDRRPRPFPIYSEAQLKTVILALEQASRAALFMHAVRQFLPSGDIEILAPYVGQGVTDV